MLAILDQIYRIWRVLEHRGAEDSGPCWKGGGSISRVPSQDWCNHSFMPHPTSFFYLPLAPSKCVSGGNFLMSTISRQITHSSFLVGASGSAGVGLLFGVHTKYPFKHLSRPSSNVQRLSQWRNTWSTHIKHTCQALVLACLNCEFLTCPDEGCVKLQLTSYPPRHPDEEQEDTSQIITNYPTNCLINESLWMIKHYFQAVLRK